jgi:prophage antirepressor-like protein
MESIQGMNKLNALITTLKSSPPNYAEPTSVKDWFLHNNIRVCIPDEGDITSLWFCLTDIARVIGDQNHWRYKSKHTRIIQMNDKNGRPHDYVMLTEQGMYHYLLRSKRPAAEPFQDWVYELLTNIRQEVVSKAERDRSLAERDLSVTNRKLTELNRAVKIRDINFNILTDYKRRKDYCLTTHEDTVIIERCYLCGVEVGTLSDRQLSYIRREVRVNEPDIVDEILATWGLCPGNAHPTLHQGYSNISSEGHSLFT